MGRLLSAAIHQLHRHHQLKAAVSAISERLTFILGTDTFYTHTQTGTSAGSVSTNQINDIYSSEQYPKLLSPGRAVTGKLSGLQRCFTFPSLDSFRVARWLYRQMDNASFTAFNFLHCGLFPAAHNLLFMSTLDKLFSQI